MIVCAAIKDNQTGAVFAAFVMVIFILPCMMPISPENALKLLRAFWIVKITFWTEMRLTKQQLLAVS